ncbi:MAG: hypothetical protein MUF83_13375 [Acidimicrobiales bacterium]|jgi:hypothetical protein|nr:hypothetical protein [Acidimicrobiales bacterium]
MAVPFPEPHETKLVPPDEAEVGLLGRGVCTAVAPDGGLTPLQRVLIRALFDSMTGFPVDPDAMAPITAEELALALRDRNEQFRARIVQVMLLCELILVPLPPEVSSRVEAFAAELGVDDGLLRVARRYAEGSLGLALIDFNRNGYTADWDPGATDHLHTSQALAEAWEMAPDDPALASRWAALEQCPDGSLGRRIWEFYRARGFTFPGLPGSAPPLLAQHDWVHIVADYGTTVESELEVFGLIGRAIPDPRGFSLLAMVIGLFETGYVHAAAGLFEYDRGHLSQEGMAVRLADAMRRGALCGRDLLAMDWFARADRPVEEVRAELGIVDKSAAAVAAGSVGPWEPGGISPYQLGAGRERAAAEARPYDSYGAAAADDASA